METKDKRFKLLATLVLIATGTSMVLNGCKDKSTGPSGDVLSPAVVTNLTATNPEAKAAGLFILSIGTPKTLVQYSVIV